MNRDFNEWINNFKSSISNYSYYVDFEKIYKIAEKYKVELNILNSLIGSKTIEDDFKNIILRKKCSNYLKKIVIHFFFF